MPTSLSRRLFGGSLLVLTAAVAVIAWQSRTVEGHLVEARQREWAFRALSLAAAQVPRPALAGNDRAALDAWCDRIGTAARVRFTLIAADGTLLGDTFVSRDSLHLAENHSGRPEVVEALSKGEGWARRRSHTIGSELWYGAIPLAPGSGPRPVLRIAVPESTIRAESGAETHLLLLALLVGLLAAALLSMGSGHILSRRLGSTLDAARRMGSGDLTARAPTTPDDEVGRLGRALNRMASGLEQRYHELAVDRDERERILAHMAEGVALLDGDGRVLHANPGMARLLGLAQPPGAGTRFQDVARLPVLADLLERARERSEALTEELRLYNPAERMVEATVVNLGPAGEPTSQLLVMHDLSRIKQLERVRQEFVANVSHELKTPLTLIRGCAETLLDGGLDDEARRRDFVETIERHATRLQRIVEDLLELARLERPGEQAKVQELDLEELVRAVCGAFEAPATRKGIEIAVRTPGAPLKVLGDPGRVERALFNLLDNAVKYTETGSVTVSLGRDPGLIWCEVRDTGPGIAPEHLPRLFERFYRVDQGRSRDLGGTGLGLSIVRHAVEQMGGRVSASSELGRGSVFRIELPAASA